MSARIAIRVDASTTIGLGHVKRCLSLAHALRAQGAAVRFVVRSLDVDASATVMADGFTCEVLPQPQDRDVVDDQVSHAPWAAVDWQTDAVQMISSHSSDRTDWVIVDHYAFDARWHTAVASGLACRIAAIDDLADRSMAVDMLIDHNQAQDHRRKYGSRLLARTILLGGPQFALLGPSYATAKRYAFHADVRSIGVFLGGVDAGDFSSLVVQACRKAGFKGSIEIATTRSNPNLDRLLRAAATDPDLSVAVDLPELSTFFARHDLQIGASGGATWERCCIGAPTLAIIAAANQRQVLLPLSRLGVAHAIESMPPSCDEIARAVGALVSDSELRRQLAQRASTLVDGFGAVRVARELLTA